MNKDKDSRKNFIKKTTAGISAIMLGGIPTITSSLNSNSLKKKRKILDGLMHLEVSGAYWEGLIDEVIEHYNFVGIDKGVIVTTWTPSRESNDRTLLAYKKYPNRFIPFGHVRPEDTDWEKELKRVSEAPWKGLKLHQGELGAGNRDIKEETRKIVKKALEFGINLVKIHFVNYEAINELTSEFSEVTWILPHMGCYGRWREMQKFCELAKNRKNVFLDTCAVAQYYDMGKGIEWAGIDKVTFATDGFEYSPLVEKAIIETLQLPTPFRTQKLTDEEMDQIMWGNMARLLGL